jgi:hypothetical protein
MSEHMPRISTASDYVTAARAVCGGEWNSPYDSREHAEGGEPRALRIGMPPRHACAAIGLVALQGTTF